MGGSDPLLSAIHARARCSASHCAVLAFGFPLSTSFARSSESESSHRLCMAMDYATLLLQVPLLHSKNPLWHRIAWRSRHLLCLNFPPGVYCSVYYCTRPFAYVFFQSDLTRCYQISGMYPRARRMNDGPAPIFPEYPPHDAIIIDPCFEPSLPPLPSMRVFLCVCSEARRARDSDGNTNAHDMRPVCEYFYRDTACCSIPNGRTRRTGNFLLL